MIPGVNKPLRIALVEMPFGPAAWPSIGTSLLKAQLDRAGHECRAVYLNHLLLPYLGSVDQEHLQIYHEISDAFGIHLGEWIFGPSAFPKTDWTKIDQEFLALVRNMPAESRLIDPSLALRAQVDSFLRACMDCVDWGELDVVGFANSYSQLNASLGLAHRLRERFPELPMIVGGCGCSDIMGVAIMKASPLFRAVSLGEADLIISDLVEAVRNGRDERLATVPGIAYRTTAGEVRYGRPKERVIELDTLPYPDYSDYYKTVPIKLKNLLPFYIPIESSRGCWWGAKSHCTFCGLNPDRMAFNSKQPERFLAEVEHLAKCHRPRRFMAVDNIMPHGYYKSVLPHLAEVSGEAEFFFEVKANFRRDQLELFRRSHVWQIQPGIESLSSRVLRLMGKGTTGIANIYTLRLCEELGLRPHWSILYGFAGEQLDDYILTARLVERIQHLRPPLGLVAVEVERFSPMFRMPAEHGLCNLRPSFWYRFCYPIEDNILSDLAYRFDADYVDRDVSLTPEIELCIVPLVQNWRSAYSEQKIRLEQVKEGGRIKIVRQTGWETITYMLGDTATDLYHELDAPCAVRKLMRARMPTDDFYEPLMDASFESRAKAAAYTSGTRVSISTSDRFQAYTELLLHGLVAQQEGQAVALACHSNREVFRHQERLDVQEVCV